MKELISSITSNLGKLRAQIDEIELQNKTLLEKSKLFGSKYDEELLKQFMSEYWYIYSGRKETETYIAVPRFINFSVGWLDHTTQGYNVFRIDQYAQWLSDIPDFIKKEVHLQDALKVHVLDGTLMFEDKDEETIRKAYGENLANVGRGTAKIKKGREFDLIAALIEGGSLPFLPHPVEQKDLKDENKLVKMEGKFSFQRDAWELFLKTGALGVYWMTGSGKDIFSTYALSRVRVGDLPNLYVSPSRSITEQMKEEYLPKYAPDLLKDIESGKLVLTTYQNYEKIKDKEYGLTVFGECHILPADGFSKLATIRTKYRIGQSATPYREDGRTAYIFALTGFPTGLSWTDTARLLGKHYHEVNVYIVSNLEAKFSLAQQLFKPDEKTLFFVNELAIGEKLANKLSIPFISGETKGRLQIAKESKAFVASRVFELGISLKDLEHIIEIDFLYGSRREELQRTGRLLHSEKAKRHDIIFTEDEFEAYGKRLHGFLEKGFRVNLKPMTKGTFEIKKTLVPKKSGRNNSVAEIMATVDKLIDEGFFKKKRGRPELTEALRRRGFSESALSVANKNMTHFLDVRVRNGKLYRIDPDKGRIGVEYEQR